MILDHLDLVFYGSSVHVKLALESFKAILCIALCGTHTVWLYSNMAGFHN